MDDLFLAPDRPVGPETLTVSFDAWEGPLDLLLALARTQKVDLREISILALVEQYLGFIDGARELKLELAADYLVMAAWLAYLKSGLLLPRDEQIDPSPEELALRLQLRLQRLAAMREAGARLMARDRVGRDVFVRPSPEGLRTVRRAAWQASLFDLIQAYGQIRARTQPTVHVVARRPVMTLDEAISRIGALVGTRIDWTALQSFLPEGVSGALGRSALASSFVAVLELARQGRVDIQQDGIFAPLFIRAAQPDAAAHS
ncbi:MAG: segregation and condensation protein A [Sphingobium sp.]